MESSNLFIKNEDRVLEEVLALLVQHDKELKDIKAEMEILKTEFKKLYANLMEVTELLKFLIESQRPVK